MIASQGEIQRIILISNVRKSGAFTTDVDNITRRDSADYIDFKCEKVRRVHNGR